MRRGYFPWPVLNCASAMVHSAACGGNCYKSQTAVMVGLFQDSRRPPGSPRCGCSPKVHIFGCIFGANLWGSNNTTLHYFEIHF